MENVILHYLVTPTFGAYRVIERELANDSRYEENKKNLDREMSNNYIFSRKITATEATKAIKSLKYLDDLLHDRG